MADLSNIGDGYEYAKKMNEAYRDREATEYKRICTCKECTKECLCACHRYGKGVPID